ncbi:LHFPL5 family protein [Megaselia abdita]
MGIKMEYSDSSEIYATNYIRNSKAITVLWAIFTICYSIITIVAFITPEWIGDPDHEFNGFVGLWHVCDSDEASSCAIDWKDVIYFRNITSKIATVFMAIAVVSATLTILFMLSILFCNSTKVYRICGWLQCSSAIFMILACVSFPLCWNSDQVRWICGPEANKFEFGTCDFRWAYPLAIIGCLDGCILSTLAFILATRNVRLQTDSKYKGVVNNAFIIDGVSLAGSRKSLNLQPILVVGSHQHMNTDDTVSQFSTNNRFNRPELHNFQL